MSGIIAKIKNTVEKYNMFGFGDSIAIGVSGGADSMLLLSYFLSVRESMNLEITVANVEHGVRGDESLRDTEFVKKFCEKNEIRFAGLSINAPDEAKAAGLGVEEYSRKRRYEFFRSLGCDKIATAHNMSDNAETVIFRLARGTSLKGASGIPPVRGNIIRPLIECSSDEIRSYCRENSIDYCIDSTNENVEYSRNYIRQIIMPSLEQINSCAEKNIANFALTATEDENFLNSLSQEAFTKALENDRLNIKSLQGLDISVRKRVIIRYLKQFNLVCDSYHLNRFAELCVKAGKYQLNSVYSIVSNSKFLRLIKNDRSDSFCAKIVNKNVISYKEFLTKCELFKKEFDFFADCDRIVGDVFVRCKEPSDSISPAGRNCTKKLKKLFNEYHIDLEKRDLVPIICDEQGVIGVFGLCVDERVKPNSSTQSVLMLNILMEDNR